MATIEYVYSAHSAYAYLGSAELSRICADHHATLVHKPILLTPVVESQGSQPFRARTQAHVAAWMSVCGLANVHLGLSHGIGHQLGARNDVPHGVTSCVMMHPTMTYNKDHVGDRQIWLAEILGHDTASMSPEEAAAHGRDGILKLVTDLELPNRLKDVGVTPENFPAIAKDALEDLVVASNPRPVASVEEVIDLLHQAY